MKEIIKDVMIQLGHDKWVRSDAIIAVEPITGRFFNTDASGNRVRSRVLINHAEGEILASRTAETILKSMIKQEESNGKVIENGREVWKWDKPGMSEKDQIIHSLIHWSTLEGAIDDLPFGRSKFYKLIKEHGIDIKEYLKSTDDPDSFIDQVKDDGLA